jgi:hypothetical protein
MGGRDVGGGAVEAVISRPVAVAEGDVVFTSGPGALVFGTVVKIADNPSSPQVALRIMPAVNLFSLTWVNVHHAGRSL